MFLDIGPGQDPAAQTDTVAIGFQCVQTSSRNVMARTWLAVGCSSVVLPITLCFARALFGVRLSSASVLAHPDGMPQYERRGPGLAAAAVTVYGLERQGGLYRVTDVTTTQGARASCRQLNGRTALCYARSSMRVEPPRDKTGFERGGDAWRQGSHCDHVRPSVRTCHYHWLNIA